MSVRSGSPTPSALSDQSLSVRSALKPPPQQDEVIFKLVFAGPHNSGKTAFVRQLQLAKNLMPAAAAAAIDSEQTTTTGDGPTIGVDFSSVVYIVKKPQEVNIRLQLWDTAGKGGYTLTDDESTAVYQNVNAISIFFDCRSYASFRRAQEKWIPYALKQIEGKPLVGPECIFLVGTRSKEWNPTAKGVASGDPQSLDLDMISIEEEDDEDDIGTSTSAVPRREVRQEDIDELLQTFPSIPKTNVFCVDCSDGKSIQPWIAKTCQVLLVRFANEVKKAPSKPQEEKDVEPQTNAAAADRATSADEAASIQPAAAPAAVIEQAKPLKPPPAAVVAVPPAAQDSRPKPVDIYSPRDEEPENSDPKRSDDDHSDKEEPSEPDSPVKKEPERPTRPSKPDTPTESEKDSDDSDDSDSSDGEGGKKKKKKKPKPKPKPKKRVRSRYSDTEDEDEEEEEPTPVRREPVDAKSGCCSGGGCTCS